MCTLYVRMTADTLRAMSMCTCTPYVCTAPNAILVMLCYAHTLCVCTTADPIHAMPMCTRTPYMYVCTTPIAIHAMPMCTQTPCVQTLHYFITSNSMLCNVCAVVKISASQSWGPRFDSRPGRGLNIWVTFFPAKVHSAFHPPGVGKMSTSIHGPIWSGCQRRLYMLPVRWG